MVTIEQVKLLEQKIASAIEYVTGVIDENRLLKTRMDGYQKRIEELEILIQRFKEDQGRIEEGIVSALDQLNRFEDSVSGTSGAVSATAAAASLGRPAPSVPPTAAPDPVPESVVAEEESPFAADDSALTEADLSLDGIEESAPQESAPEEDAPETGGTASDLGIF